MFFLKELPTRQMVEAYAGRHDVRADTIIRGLASMRRASLLIRRLDAYFAEHRFSQLRFLMLIVIDREPHRRSLSVGEITQRLDVAGPVVARTLRGLVDEDLVCVRRDAEDGRTKHVALTEAGSARLAALLPDYFAIIADEMEGEAEWHP